MDDEALLTLCLAIAEDAHQGQTDKAGSPYVGHPVRVSARLTTTRERCVGLLHDVLEDTAMTDSELRERGVPEDIVTSVLVLTKPGPNYDEFIRAVRDSGDPVAIAVKRADIADNLDEARLARLGDEQATRLREKYGRALEILAGRR